MNKFLFKQIDNIGLVLFRVIFGALISIQSFGELATGWARRTLVEPEFTFNFIGLDFIQPLPGNWMYVYCALMGVFGLLVMVGYKYRISMLSYALMWTCIYFMQKTSYNNHYYLMMLLCWIMAFLPAHHWFSVDSHFNKKIKTPSMPRWVLLILILQVWIVYTFASVAKWYPDWLDSTVTAVFMSGKSDYWLIGDLLQLDWVHWNIAYVGILFDLLIIPLFLWKRTRLIGFGISVFFHLFNSIVFQIGIFPYMSIAFAFFFFSPEILRKLFLPKKPLYVGNKVIVPNYRNALLGILSVYFAIQIILPLRHWAIPDDVLWTEEGHRLSWRMMLRTKSARLKVWIEDKETGNRLPYKYTEMLTKKQRRAVKSKPDMLWQLAQRIKQKGAEEGKDLGVYMDVKVKVNGGVYHQFIKPDVDIAAEEWNHFGHHDWIEPSPADYHEKAVELLEIPIEK